MTQHNTRYTYIEWKVFVVKKANSPSSRQRMALAIISAAASILGSFGTLADVGLKMIPTFIVKDIFTQFNERSRTVKIRIENLSEVSLEDPTWYCHHGAQATSYDLDRDNEIVFEKAKNTFFGVNGYVQFVYAEEAGWQKRLIVTFSNPWRDKNPNKVSVALLHERDLQQKDRKYFTNGVDVYSSLKKRKHQDKMRAFDTSRFKNSCRYPQVSDDLVKVKCYIYGGATDLDIIVVITDA